MRAGWGGGRSGRVINVFVTYLESVKKILVRAGVQKKL